MTTRNRVWLPLATALIVPAAAFGAQVILSNGSMESGDGPAGLDPSVPADWIRFGNVVERSPEANLVPPGEGHSLKAFSSNPVEGAYQNVPAAPGDEVTISASLFTRADDKLGGDAQAGLVLEFYDADDGLVGTPTADFVLDASSPAETWIPVTIGPVFAPADAVTARIVCVWRWFGSASGSAYWDDCRMSINGGTNAVVNGDFEQAGVGEQSPTGIDEWAGFNDQEQSSDFAFHGQFSLKMGMGGAFSGLFQDMGTLTAGDRLLLKAKGYHSSGNPLTANSRAGLKLEFFPVNDPDLPDPVENLAFDVDAPTESWELVEVSTTGLVVPDDANLARIVMIYVADVTTNGSVYFDDAFAELASAPGTNQLLNASFEDGDGGPDGIENWSEFSSASSAAQKSAFEVPPFDGFSVMKATGTDVAGISQDISVTPGDVLDLTARLYMSTEEPLAGTATAGVKVEWRGGTAPEDIDIGESADGHTMTASSPQDEWVDLTIDFTMPAGTEALARFTNLVARGSASTGAAYIDACEAVVLNRFDGADADGDDDEDLFDFSKFQLCFSGEGVTPLGWNCTVFDSDDDEDIDLVDFDFFLPRFTGPTAGR